MSHHSPLLNRDDCLLLVIDVQTKLMPAIAQGEQVADNILKLIKLAGIIGMPLLISEQTNLGPTLPELMAAAPGAQPVAKLTFDCFGTPEFVSRLKESGRKTIILAGVEAHICVTQTALSGLARHRVQVVGDAVSSRTERNRDLALSRLRHAGVVVTTTEMAMFELLGQAGTPEFKAVLPLIVNQASPAQK